jgi:Transcriptional regulators
VKNDDEIGREVSVYDQIKQWILDGTISYGERFTEAQLAERLDVSRMPVREVVIKLLYEGFIERGEKTGYRTKRLTEQEAMDTYVFRECMDGMLTRLFTQRSNPSQLYFIQNLLQAMEKTKDGAEERSMSKVDFEFHRAIARGAGNHQMIAQFNILLEKTNYITATLLGAKGVSSPPIYTGEMAQSAYEEHRKIVDQIVRGDPDGAEQAARESVRAGLQKILSALAHSYAAL